MKYYFRLDGQSPDLSLIEFEALFKIKPTPLEAPNGFSAELNVSYDKMRIICESSALLKKVWTDDEKIWKSYSPQYPGREPKDKPGFHPTMLKPKWARMLINFTRIKPGGKLLDPFCGTGSILIEAKYLDLRPIGIDLDPKAIEKSKTNLEHYDLKCKVGLGDATKLEDQFLPESFDAIATDLPYGRSSTLGGEEIVSLYETFLKSALKVLKKGSYLVFMKPHYIENKIPQGYKKIAQGDLYAHRGLKRRAIILQKK